MRIEGADGRIRILSFNASIEMSCASDSANGSIVVAKKYNELAYQTTRATKDVAGRNVSIRAHAKHAGQELIHMGRKVHAEGGVAVEIAQQSEATSKTVRNIGYVCRDIQIPGPFSDRVQLQWRST